MRSALRSGERLHALVGLCGEVERSQELRFNAWAPGTPRWQPEEPCRLGGHEQLRGALREAFHVQRQQRAVAVDGAKLVMAQESELGQGEVLEFLKESHATSSYNISLYTLSLYNYTVNYQYKLYTMSLSHIYPHCLA